MKSYATRVSWGLVLGLCGWGWASPARADVWEYALTKGQDGRVRCERQVADASAEPGALVVRLRRSPEVREPRLTVEGVPGGGQPLKEEADAYTLRLPREKLPEGALQLVAGDVKCEPVQSPRAKGAEAPEADAPPPKELDLEATAWWQAEGRKQLSRLRAKGGFARGTRFLVHYANGERAAPFPGSVSEREPVQVVVIADAGEALGAELVVGTCEDVQPFRVTKPEAAGRLEGKRRRREWRLVPVGPLLQCGAGSLTYTLRLAEPEPADGVTRVRVRPVHNVAATVVYGFDFVKERSFGVVDGRVEQTEDEAGLGLRLGLTWFLPWGVDYEDMKPHNYVANWVLAVDPEAPTERFMTGVAVTPTGGLSLVVGVSVHRLTALAGGLRPGAEFTGSGEVPTRREWSGAGVRPFIGLSLDDNIYTAFKDRLSGR